MNVPPQPAPGSRSSFSTGGSPLTDNDAASTQQLTKAFTAHFGEGCVTEAAPQTASEDFSHIPNAFGAPYSYWFLGGVDPSKYQDAVDRGTVQADIRANHSPVFAPVPESTLSMGVRAQVVGALAFLAPLPE